MSERGTRTTTGRRASDVERQVAVEAASSTSASGWPSARVKTYLAESAGT